MVRALPYLIEKFFDALAGAKDRVCCSLSRIHNGVELVCHAFEFVLRSVGMPDRCELFAYRFHGSKELHKLGSEFGKGNGLVHGIEKLGQYI